ncbi:hypothetical protein AABB24_023657 [Solanum stoloniferum]|uniref:Uncharacterized protein n=1 Tax=Solanum stoloniferum TaxID=62892 RepID=A0ABD2SKE9_9SOLN
MATSTINHHSHWNTTADTAPQQSSRSEAAARGVNSPWAQIGQSESNIQAVHFSDCSLSEEVDGCAFESDTNSNGAKKTVWNKPSNGAADVSPVMGALSWPALSDSTKASFKSSSSSSDSVRTLPDGSVSETQVTGMASASHRQANTNNANPNTMLNHVVPSRQRSLKRGGGNSNHNASANGVFSQQQAHGFEVETVNNSGKSGNYGAEFSSRDNNRRDGGQWGGFGAQSHGGNDHQHQRNANRRGNVGPHPRGDGTYHNGYGGRRDRNGQIRIGNPTEVGGIGMHTCSRREVQLGHSWGPHLIRLHLIYLGPCLCSPINLPWFTLKFHLYFIFQVHSLIHSECLCFLLCRLSSFMYQIPSCKLE